MKLRNKQTGEIVEFHYLQTDYVYPLVLTIMRNGKPEMIRYNSLSELIKEWEDYEDPKEHWCITMYGGITRIKDNEEPIDYLKEIGNYFNSKEDAYDVLVKLKAVKRMKDNGFKIKGWKFTPDMKHIEGNYVKIEAEIPQILINEKDLDICFGGEE